MQRTGKLFERIIDRDNLRSACHKALLGKRSRADARSFTTYLERNLAEMAAQLESGEFPLGRFHQFVIHDPKERIITAPCFAERVLHHAIMNVCEPAFERSLIADTYACRVGRGRLAALDRAQQFASNFPFFLKLDIRKYFDSIPHEVLLARLQRLFKDPRVLTLFGRIIHAFRGNPGVGLPIGSLTSQHFANFYLGALDRFVKEQLRVRGYVRYMDDIALWGESPAELRVTLDACRDFLTDELWLDLKPAYWNRTEHGMDFLGCRVFQDRLTLNARSRRRFRRKLRALEAEFHAGQMDERELQQRVTAFVAFTRTPGISSWKFRRRVLQELTGSGQEARTG